MRSLLGRFHRPMSRGAMGDILTMNSLGDGSTLSLDFTTGVLDPRLTFSRASTATFVNSSGYVEYAGANLVRQSGDLSQNGVGEWTTRTNLTLTGWSGNPDPFGGSTAVIIIPNTINATHHVGTADISMSIGIPYTVSVYAKASGYSIVGIVTTNSNARAHFNLANQTSAGYGVTNTRTITDVGGGWYRLTMSFTVANGPLVSLLIYAMNTATDPVANSFAGVSASSDGVLAWGAQINPGSTVQTYYLTTTAAYHAPRFDYSPTNIGEPRGLLIEAQTTNIVKYSNQFESGDWYKGGTAATLTPNYAVGPDGVTGSAWRFTGANSNSVFATPVSNGAAAHVVSIYAKSNTGSNQTFTIYNGTSGVTCTATSVWQRFVVPVAGTWGYAYFGTLGASQDILIWGAQSELGSSGASSYIPTGASGVTRNVDNCYMNNISALSYSTTNGTLFYESLTTKWNISSYPARLGFTKETGDYRSFGALTDIGGMLPNVGGPAGTPTVLVSLPFSLNTNTKCAWSFDAALSTAEVKATINGGAIVSSTSSALTVSETPSYFGFGQKGYDLYLPSGPVKRVKYWPTTLSTTQLQTLTTP